MTPYIAALHVPSPSQPDVVVFALIDPADPKRPIAAADTMRGIVGALVNALEIAVADPARVPDALRRLCAAEIRRRSHPVGGLGATRLTAALVALEST
jgi:hypothetical protein